MWKKIGLIVGGILIVFLAYVAIQSPHYTISRSITIQASADKIFPYLNNSKLAEKWAPWLEIDPAAKMSYSGSDSGVGSRADWTEGKQLGTGSATIVESIPNKKVGIKLEYVKPMNMTQYSEYLIESSGNSTVVTWKVQGENTFPGRIMCVFMNMDKMVGGMFEKGLNNLKSFVEKS
jgi:hypothetical protein